MRIQNISKRILMFIIAISLTICLCGCELLTSFSNANIPSGSKVVDVTVNNEITNKVVDYQDITITGMENAVEETITAIEQSVVGVTLKEVTFVRQGFTNVRSEDAVSLGSGVVYKREPIYGEDNETVVNYKYYVITNRHVILPDDTTNEHVIYVYDGYSDVELVATLVGYDTKVDIALITFEYSKYINPVTFADSDDLKKGAFVIAIGNPEGYDYYGSATLGIISGNLRYISSDTDDDKVNDFTCEYIQHDASINPGNSGGGLFSLDGKLIGINTLKIASTEIDNMGFAIPSNVVKTIIYDYLEVNKEIVRPRLGVVGIAVKNLTASVIEAQSLKAIPTDIFNGMTQYGLYVKEITEGGTIDGSGIEADDIILSFDGERITSMNIVTAKLNSLVDHQVGDSVVLTYYDRSANAVVEITVVLKSGK